MKTKMIISKLLLFSYLLLFFCTTAGTVMGECPGLTEITGTENPFDGISIGSNKYLAPAVVDIDDDGDMDVFVGTADGKIFFLQNNYPDTPLFTLKGDAENPLAGISFSGLIIKPFFTDSNGDEKPDLFFSVSNDSKLHYYQNTGTKTQAAFSDKTNDDDNPFYKDGKVEEIESPPTLYGFSSAFRDIDGNTDAVFGMGNGKIKYYKKNTDNNKFDLQSDVDNPFNSISVFYFATLSFSENGSIAVGGRHLINFYKNTANTGLPVYDSGCQITGGQNKFYYPAFGDLFGNGEWKLLIGNASSTELAYYIFSDKLPGDIKKDSVIDLSDAILGLKILADADTSGDTVNLAADVDTNQKIGLEEVIYVLRKIAFPDSE